MLHLTLWSDTGIWIFVTLELHRQHNLNRINERLEVLHVVERWSCISFENGPKKRTKILRRKTNVKRSLHHSEERLLNEYLIESEKESAWRRPIISSHNHFVSLHFIQFISSHTDFQTLRPHPHCSLSPLVTSGSEWDEMNERKCDGMKWLWDEMHDHRGLNSHSNWTIGFESEREINNQRWMNWGDHVCSGIHLSLCCGVIKTSDLSLCIIHVRICLNNRNESEGGYTSSSMKISTTKSSHSESKLLAGCIQFRPEVLLIRNQNSIILRWLIR